MLSVPPILVKCKKLNVFLMVLLKNVGFVVGMEQFCGGGGDDFAGGEDHEDRVVDADVDADSGDEEEDVDVGFKVSDEDDHDHVDDGDHGYEGR